MIFHTVLPASSTTYSDPSGPAAMPTDRPKGEIDFATLHDVLGL